MHTCAVSLNQRDTCNSHSGKSIFLMPTQVEKKKQNDQPVAHNKNLIVNNWLFCKEHDMHEILTLPTKRKRFKGVIHYL